MFTKLAFKSLLIGLLSFSLTACVAAKAPKLTSLEIQAFQAKTFDTSKGIAFASVMSVFQDLGYNVSSAEKDTGFITAKSPTRGGIKIFVGTSQVFTNATAFIETINNQTRIRLNFVEVEKVSTAYGQERGNDTPILDANIYQNAFNKIGDAIFIRSASN